MPLPSADDMARPPQQAAGDRRLMWITPARVFYAGLLGEPAMHAKGALAVCVASSGRLRIAIDGQPAASTEVAVVPPGVPFRLTADARHVLVLLIEPETVAAQGLPFPLQGCGAAEAPDFATHVRDCHARLVAMSPEAVDALSAGDFDAWFFGAALPARPLDVRIATTLQRLQADPARAVTAAQCAAEAGLSFSRFLHLFKAETGQSFRALRAWKRARSLLHHVRRDENLVHVALDIGYPDSTHFSHSIRQTYGLKPRDIFAGSRKLRVIGGGAPMGLAAG